MKGILKMLRVPTGATKTVEAVESWTVSWRARTGNYHDEYKVRHEVFIDKNIADEYAQRLKEATEFLRDEWPRNIQVTKN